MLLFMVKLVLIVSKLRVNHPIKYAAARRVDWQGHLVGDGRVGDIHPVGAQSLRQVIGLRLQPPAMTFFVAFFYVVLVFHFENKWTQIPPVGKFQRLEF